MVSNSPLLSLIVLSFRRFDQTTGPCMASLLAQDLDASAELLMVDNGSDDGSAERCAELAAREPRLRFVAQPRNLGFGGGMNAGVHATNGHWVVLVNSDTVFPPGSLAALGRTLLDVPTSVAMVGPVTNSAGNGQNLPLPQGDLADHLRVGAAAVREPTGLLVPTYWTDFFCVAIRRDVWTALGGLDPVFGLGYYEDFDFSLRVRAAGLSQVIAEDVFIVHTGSSTFFTMADRQRELMRRNRAILKQRHPEARFHHRREGNAHVLRFLAAEGAQLGWSGALRLRAAWRLAALLDDMPRSPFKRWRWRRSVQPLVRALGEAGIVPQYPTAPPHDDAFPTTDS